MYGPKASAKNSNREKKKAENSHKKIHECMEKNSMKTSIRL